MKIGSVKYGQKLNRKYRLLFSWCSLLEIKILLENLFLFNLHTYSKILLKRALMICIGISGGGFALRKHLDLCITGS